jgi:hypothetical protein
LSQGQGIRERLQQWELDNAEFLLSGLPKSSLPVYTGEFTNTLIQGEDEVVHITDTEQENGTGLPFILNRNELVDIEDSRKFLMAGDLVELRFVLWATQYFSMLNKVVLQVLNLSLQYSFETLILPLSFTVCTL